MLICAVGSSVIVAPTGVHGGLPRPPAARPPPMFSTPVPVTFKMALPVLYTLLSWFTSGTPMAALPVKVAVALFTVSVDVAARSP